MAFAHRRKYICCNANYYRHCSIIAAERAAALPGREAAMAVDAMWQLWGRGLRVAAGATTWLVRGARPPRLPANYPRPLLLLHEGYDLLLSVPLGGYCAASLRTSPCASPSDPIPHLRPSFLHT